MKLTFLISFLTAVTANAAITGYASNPTGNSTDFANAVAALYGTIGDVHLTVDYEAHPLGALQPNFYGGLTVNFTSPAVVTASLSTGGDTTSGTHSDGEGLVTGGRHISPGSAAFTMEVTFIHPIAGFGFYVIDHYNPVTGGNFATLSAYSGPNGTGTLLGSADAPQYNFQSNYKYFIGLVSTNSDIASVTFTTNGAAGDGIYIDDLELAEAPTPEPGTWMMAGTAVALLAAYRRR